MDGPEFEKICATTHRMMVDRTYQNIIKCPFASSNDSGAKKTDTLAALKAHTIWIAEGRKDQPEEGRCIVINTDWQLGISVVRVLETFMRESNINNCVYICPTKPTGSAKTFIAKLNDLQIHLFNQKEVTIPYVDHVLCPRTVKRISKEEANAIIKMKDDNKDSQKVPVTDSLIKWYGWKVGQYVMTLTRVPPLPDQIAVDLIEEAPSS
jgi:hypothetical protein